MAVTADPANTETGDDVDTEYASIQFSDSEEQEKHGHSAVLMHRNSPSAARRWDDHNIAHFSNKYRIWFKNDKNQFFLIKKSLCIHHHFIDAFIYIYVKIKSSKSKLTVEPMQNKM